MDHSKKIKKSCKVILIPALLRTHPTSADCITT
jgi:hypothetical protein